MKRVLSAFILCFFTINMLHGMNSQKDDASKKDLTKSFNGLGSFYDIASPDGKLRQAQGEPVVEQVVPQQASSDKVQSPRGSDQQQQEEHIHLKAPSRQDSPRQIHQAPQEAVAETAQPAPTSFQERLAKKENTQKEPQPAAKQEAPVTIKECSLAKPILLTTLAAGALYAVHKPTRQKVNDLISRASKKIKESRRAQILVGTSLLAAAGLVWWCCTHNGVASNV